MIHPRPTDVLRTIIANLDSKVIPNLTDVDVLSAVTTCKHMARYVINQLAQERTIFLAEIPRLRDLLDQAGSFYHRQSDAGEMEKLIAEAVGQSFDDGDIEALAAHVASLREALYQALGQLIDRREDYRDDPDYTALRDAIRAYLAWQNEQDALIVAPTFYGQGARR